jgi:branched-subunit amino acid transport protein
MTWPALLGLAACAYTMKAAGPLLLGDRTLSARWNEVLGLIAVPLLAALIVVQTVTDGHRYVIDSRLAGLAVAAVAVWRRAPFIVVVLLAAVTGAAAHAIGG